MRNISLSVDAGYLDVDSVVDLDLLNPLFHDLSGHTLPFTIPLTKNNRDKLGIDHEPMNYNLNISFDAKIQIFSKIIFGKLNIEKSKNENELVANFISGRGAFFSSVKNKKINEVNYSELVSTGDISASAFQTKAIDTVKNPYPDNNFVFAPIYMPNIDDLGNTLDDEWNIINDFIPGSSARFETHSQTIGYFNFSASQYSPLFYLHFVFKKIFEEYGYTIDRDDFYEDTELRRLVIYSHNLFYFDTNFGYATFQDYLPKVHIEDLIKWFEKRYNFRFIFHEGGKTVSIINIENSIIDTSYSNITDKAGNIIDIDHFNYDGLSLSNQFDTDDSFLSDKIQTFDEPLNNDNIDIVVEYYSSLTTGSIGDIAFVRSENKFYIWGVDVDTDTLKWLEHSSGFLNYEVKGTNNYESSSEISSMIMVNPLISINIKLLPRSDYERVLNIIYLLGSKNTISKLCLLHYRGQVPTNGIATLAELEGGSYNTSKVWYVLENDTSYEWNEIDFEWVPISGNNFEEGFTENYYPLLSNSLYFALANGDPARIPDLKYTMSFFGNDGIYEKFFKNTLYWVFYLRKKVVLTINFSFFEIDSLDWSKKYRRLNQNYFFSKVPINIDFANQKVSVGECELFSV
jgi:hypothetical protein